MNAAAKMAAFIIALLLIVSFINHGQLSIGAGPKGASFNTAYYGLVP